MVEILENRFLQGGHASERAAPDAFFGDLGEESLDLVQPRSARWREVDLVPGSFGQPALNAGGFVGRVVVHHQMNVDTRFLRDGLIDVVQEFDKLLLPMPRLTRADRQQTWGHCKAANMGTLHIFTESL